MNSSDNKNVLKNVLIDILKGGFGVVLPTFGMIYLIIFIYKFIVGLLDPLTKFLANYLNFPSFLIDIFSMVLVISLCFICGVVLKTKFGKFMYFLYEKSLKKLKIFKLFNTLQEIYNQIFTKEDKSFNEVVLAFPFGRRNAGLTGLISSRYTYKQQNYIIVFFPTCPNFTSGFSLHTQEENVDILEGVPVDKVMRTIIACGSGTKELFREYNISDVVNKTDFEEKEK